MVASLGRAKSQPALTIQESSDQLLSPNELREYLARFGLDADDERTWSQTHVDRVGTNRQPMLEVAVVGSAVADGHNWYTIQCAYWRPSVDVRRAEWKVTKRVSHIRKELHDPVKDAFGAEAYARHFQNAHFASSWTGSAAAIEARLRGWCQALARCFNNAAAPPVLAAATLRLLGAPVQHPAIQQVARSCGLEALRIAAHLGAPTSPSSSRWPRSSRVATPGGAAWPAQPGCSRKYSDENWAPFSPPARLSKSSSVGTLRAATSRLADDMASRIGIAEVKELVRNFTREMVQGKSLNVVLPTGDLVQVLCSLSRPLDAFRLQMGDQAREVPLSAFEAVLVGGARAGAERGFDELMVAFALRGGERLTFMMPDASSRDAFAMCFETFARAALAHSASKVEATGQAARPEDPSSPGRAAAQAPSRGAAGAGAVQPSAGTSPAAGPHVAVAAPAGEDAAAVGCGSAEALGDDPPDVAPVAAEGREAAAAARCGSLEVPVDEPPRAVPAPAETCEAAAAARCGSPEVPVDEPPRAVPAPAETCEDTAVAGACAAAASPQEPQSVEPVALETEKDALAVPAQVPDQDSPRTSPPAGGAAEERSQAEGARRESEADMLDRVRREATEEAEREKAVAVEKARTDALKEVERKAAKKAADLAQSRREALRRGPRGRGTLEMTPEFLDGLLDDLDNALKRVQAGTGRVARIRAELEFVSRSEAVRDFMSALLRPDAGGQSPGASDLLRDIVGGRGCRRLARLRAMLQVFEPSEPGTKRRLTACEEMCESVEQVLQDSGFGDELREALALERGAREARNPDHEESGQLPHQLVLAR